MGKIRSLVLKVGAVGLASTVLPSWWYRPQKDKKDGTGTSRLGWISSFDYHDTSCKSPPLPYQVMSGVITFLTVSVSCVFLRFAGSYEIIDDENYRFFLRMARERDPDTPLITLSNHRSLLDDPLILSALLPFELNCRPRYLRWGACAQEICFKEDHLLATYFGAGKSLPMWRGGGIDQALLLQLARKAVASPTTGRHADWIHVYPEAGVFQLQNRLGGRRNGNEESIGKLKWGVAKLIAHNPSYKIPINPPIEEEGGNLRKYKSPVVIPFYFVGTERITPLHPITRILQTIQGGHKVVVRFGPPIYFDDLIDEFLEHQGKGTATRDQLRVYHCCDDPAAHGNELDKTNLMYDMKSWKSSPEEKLLYRRIIRRAENSLQALCERCPTDAVEKDS